jgi:hypothetical protein
MHFTWLAIFILALGGAVLFAINTMVRRRARARERELQQEIPLKIEEEPGE